MEKIIRDLFEYLKKKEINIELNELDGKTICKLIDILGS